MKKSLRDSIIALSRFAGRLGRDVAGNTLAMMAIATIPIAAMVGSGVDMSRAYMVKSRLQQACDAGALAGRRAMTGPTLDSNAETQARNLFNFNFPAGTMNTTNVVFTPTNTVDQSGNPAGQVTATATATLPTTIMQMFGKQSIVLEVDCDAKLEVTNTDVMFVLDVTGSMNCAVGVSGDCGLVEQTNSKLSALRSAVVNFYTTLNSAMTTDARLRIGFVPYSTTVNVGYLLPSNYLVDSWAYQSRRRFPDGTYTTSTDDSGWVNDGVWTSWSGWTTYEHTANNSTTSGQCSTPGNSTSDGTVTTTGGTPSTDANGVITTETTEERVRTETDYDWTWGVNDTSGTSRDCRKRSRTRTRDQVRTVTVTQTPNYDWSYEQWTPPAADFASYKAGNAVTTMTGNTSSTNGPATAVSSTWLGCIEERRTVAQTTFTTIPSNAYDMDIDMVPTSDPETKWKPAWTQIIYDRPTVGSARPDVGPKVTDLNSGSGYSKPSGNGLACPKAAQKLQEMTLDQVKQYVNAAPYNTSPTFKGVGYTYHDVGMIWGARLLSPTGIFASENATAPNGKPINRHIIFMTDGDMTSNVDSYGLYGMEGLDGRVGNGTTSDLVTRQNNRFVAMCNAARAKNITIWVVAYANALNAQLTSCADSGKAFTAANDAQLQSQFQMIAQRIAKLRLSK